MCRLIWCLVFATSLLNIKLSCQARIPILTIPPINLSSSICLPACNLQVAGCWSISCQYQAFRRSFFSRNRSSNSSFVKIQELFLFSLLFSRNCYFSRSFFSSFSPDAKPATKPTNSNQLLYILILILLYFTAVLNYLILFHYNIT